ncbi:Protein SZT2 [Fasciolopsis buskii]|uniref:Protein SZT2 n=1 Tax=Fasciolopsis buskii TaxID=27845 RepID=A0A8E0S3T8_9TREM|nr:Protein SZT2 [Fasciolopsis buski]
MFVRLGTIELSRFSRHASRALICGPFTAQVITQAAASAAASVASVMRDAASGHSDSHSPSYPDSPSPRSGEASGTSQSQYTTKNQVEHNRFASGFSWDESSRLCDYTHVNSFSYDYYMWVIQYYLSRESVFETFLFMCSFNFMLQFPHCLA